MGCGPGHVARYLRDAGANVFGLDLSPGMLEQARQLKLWGRVISMDFFLYPPLVIRRCLEAAGFLIEDVVEREPYDPQVEYQSRRAYILARKTGSHQNK